MTTEQLKAQYEQTNTNHRDFKKWAKESHGVTISSNVVLSHLGRYGKPRKISEGFQIAYSVFFEEKKLENQ